MLCSLRLLFVFLSSFNMVAVFSLLSDICPGADCLIIRGRIIRLWCLRPTPDVPPSSIELVLADEKGGRIHASVLKDDVELFLQRLVEGEVYEISSFSIASSVGSHRASLHSWKIVFNAGTILHRSRLDSISMYALAPVKLGEISRRSCDCSFLVDVVGYATGITSQRDYFVDGKISSAAIVELIDDSGSAECLVVGDCFHPLKEYLSCGQPSFPVVVLRFVKIQIFRGHARIETVSNVTSVLVNADISEVSCFRQRMFDVGFVSDFPVNVLDSTLKGSEETDFLRLYPLKTVSDVADLVDDGIFVLCGAIVDVIKGEDWWVATCQCHRTLRRSSGSFFCHSCVGPVLCYQLMFRVKIQFSDGTGAVPFSLSDSSVYHLIRKHCSDFMDNCQGNCDLGFPSELLAVKGRKIALKVERRSSLGLYSAGTTRAKRVCCSLDILNALLDERCVHSIEEHVKQTGVLDVSPHYVKGFELIEVLDDGPDDGQREFSADSGIDNPFDG